MERWHQSIQNELLAEHNRFESLAEAQAAVDVWRIEYNTTRPHQSLDMDTPAARFAAAEDQRHALPLWLPTELAALAQPSPACPPTPQLEPPVPPAELPLALGGATPVSHAYACPQTTAASCPDAVEVDRLVPPSGNLQVGRQQFWLGPHRAGQPVTLWIDTTTVHLSLDGRHLKTVPSRLSTVDLARLRAEGARPAGPPPAKPSVGMLAAGAPIEIDRNVNANGFVILAGHHLSVGSPLAGRRITLRLEAQLVHVVVDGLLWRTIPFTLAPTDRIRLRGARLAGPPPQPGDAPIRVQRRVCCRGGTMVIGQKIHVGFRHAGTTVTIEIDDTELRVLDQHDQVLTVVARTSRKEVKRYKAYGHTHRPTA